MQKIDSTRLSFGTLFRILYIGNLVTSIVFFLIVGIIGALTDNVKFGDQAVHGWKAVMFIPLSIVASFPLAGLFAVFIWISVVPGLLLYSRFKPFPIHYEPLLIKPSE